LRWPVPHDLAQRLVGRAIDGLDRRSKYLLFRLGEGTLLVHLGMTGSLRAFSRSPPRRLHDHVDLVLDDGVTLRYHDPRRFGAILWVADAAERHPLLASLGPEPFDPAFDAAYLWRATRRRSAAIKLALMDNHLVVGVGNIYANEALFAAGIDPSREAARLSGPEWEALHRELLRILWAAVGGRGSTVRDYRTGTGAKGKFQLSLLVYGREGEPCVQCGTPLAGTHALDARITVFCHRCQR
jgi:formamidopyrimidine-DNA glycosylase